MSCWLGSIWPYFGIVWCYIGVPTVRAQGRWPAERWASRPHTLLSGFLLQGMLTPWRNGVLNIFLCVCVCIYWSVSWLSLMTVEWISYQAFCARWDLVSFCVHLRSMFAPFPWWQHVVNNSAPSVSHTLRANERGTYNDLHRERKNVSVTVCAQVSSCYLY